jgi:uncharacterized circularly permuted ATP-grasp superfamily protein
MASDADERPAFTDGYTEDRDEAGTPRAGYAQLFEALAPVKLSPLSDQVRAQLERDGVEFGGEAFVVDPIPRLIPAAEWEALAGGLAQRARALNRFLHDAYGERRVIEAGVAAADALESAQGYEPDLRLRLPAHGAPAAVVGFDIVRAPSGEFMVLEDNLRTPSGIAYVVAARTALAATLPPGCPLPRPIDPLIYELLGRCLRAAAPAGVEDPFMIVLTDGPENVAYFEHAQAAERLEIPLVVPADLIAEGDRLQVRLPGGRPRRVDVVYRRTDEDRVRDEAGALTEVARLLLPAWLGGQLGLVNAFGNGIADDKLIHGHVEDFIRFYLGEEPMVRSVPTGELRGAGDARKAIAGLRELVIKPRHGHGGKGVVIGAHAEPAKLEQLAGELEAHPEQYISQPTVALSLHPSVVDGRLERRHVDLRVFAFCADEVEIAPGGLSRVALEEHALVVNSSQHGGGKDTWVID